MDDRGEMLVYTTVVEKGSFAEAARALNLTPSAASKKVSRLEDRLGVRLLDRTTRRLSVTEVGQIFYERTVRILADISEAEHAASLLYAAPRGLLRASSSVAFAQRQIMPLLPEFLERYPELQLQLAMGDGPVDLLAEGIDVAIRFEDQPEQSMIRRKLAGDPWVVCAAPAYLERHGRPAHPSELTHHNCLSIHARGRTTDHWEFQGPDGVMEVPAKGNLMTVGNAIHDAVVAGIGIGRMANFLVEEDIREGRLVRLLADFPPPGERSISVVYPHSRHLTPKVRAFVDFLVEKFTPVPPWQKAR